MTSSHIRDTVLVIDDDANLRTLILTCGEIWGIPTIEAQNGSEGIEILEREKNRIKLILLDYFMPGMTPIDCANSLRNISRELIPIILVTAAVDPSKYAKELKLTRWLAKPFDLATLEQIMKEEFLISYSPKPYEPKLK